MTAQVFEPHDHALMTAISPRTFLGRSLFYGVPTIVAEVTLVFAFLDRSHVVSLVRFDEVILLGHAAVASAGAAAAGALGRGRTSRRATTALLAAVVGLFAYARLFVSGMLVIVELPAR